MKSSKQKKHIKQEQTQQTKDKQIKTQTSRTKQK